MRGPDHLSAEKFLERMFLLDSLFEIEDNVIRAQEEIEFDQAILEFEKKAELGWMTFEDLSKTAKQELGTFFVVQ